MKPWILRTVFFVLLILFPAKIACAGEDSRIYSLAVRAARSGELDFAYMRYHQLLRDFPETRYKKQCLLASGEYYFRQDDYRATEAVFAKFVRLYPDDPGKLFALAYLYRIAQSNNDEVKMDVIRQDIISFKQVSLVFKDYEYYKYTSPMNLKYKAIFHIDKIQFLVQGDLLAEVYL